MRRVLLWAAIGWLISGVSGCTLARGFDAQPAAAAGAVGLAQYTLRTGPIRIPGVQEDASGVTFVPESRSLFIAVNSAALLVELSLDGKTAKRVIELKGFEDTEGVTVMEGNTFAVVEERRRRLCIFEIREQTKVVPYRRAKTHLIERTAPDNVGLEGIAYDPGGGRFFLVKEKQPRRVYSVDVSGREGRGRVKLATPWNAEAQSFGLSDLWIHYHPPTGHLLILSDESECIVECTTAGREIARLSLGAGSAGLADDVPQAEGLTMDDAGNLYVCSEPNLLYIFEKEKP